MNVNGKKKVEVWGYAEFDKALKSCLGNRPLSRKRVQKYLRMHLGGTYDGLNADPFLFYSDKKGVDHLFEGVHRCMAGRAYTQMTGNTVPVLVERGLDPECVKHRGNGNQTIGDLLVKTRKQQNAINHAAIAAAVAQIFTGDNSVGSLDEYDAWVAVCPKGIEAASQLLKNHRYRIAPVIATMAVAYEVEPEAVIRIIQAVMGETDMKAGSPARALDFRMDNRRSMNLMGDRYAMMKIVFEACYAEAKHMKIERLGAGSRGRDYFVNSYKSNKKLQELIRIRSVLRSAPIEMNLVPEGTPV